MSGAASEPGLTNLHDKLSYLVINLQELIN